MVLIPVTIQQPTERQQPRHHHAMHFTAVVAVLGSAALTYAHPTKRHASLAPCGIANLDAFRLPMMANYTSAKDVKAPQHNMMPFAPKDPVEVATEHIKTTNPGLTFRVVNDHYVGSNGISHIRFKQTMHDIDIDNADYNVNVSTLATHLSYTILTLPDRRRWQRLLPRRNLLPRRIAPQAHHRQARCCKRTRRRHRGPQHRRQGPRPSSRHGRVRGQCRGRRSRRPELGRLGRGGRAY